MAVIYWIGTINGDLFEPLNWFGGVRPGVSDVATWDSGTHAIINFPSADSGSARTWGGAAFIDEGPSAWDGDGGVFSGITVVGNVDASFPLSLNLKSVNGSITGNVNFSLNLESQQSGHTATLHEDVSFALAGIGSVTFASDFVGEIAVDAYDGSITVDTITLDGFGSFVSALAISQLRFINGGKLTNFLGPVSEVVWCGYTSANPLTASNWSNGSVPGNGGIYIDSRIEINGDSLLELEQLPIEWASGNAIFDSITIADGGGLSYNWGGDNAIAVNDNGSITMASVNDLTLHFLGEFVTFSGSITGTFTLTRSGLSILAPTDGFAAFFAIIDGSGDVTFTDATMASAIIGTAFTGYLQNARTNPTGAGIVDLNGSILSTTTFPARMFPSTSAFTNFTNTSGGGGVAKNLLLMGV